MLDKFASAVHSWIPDAVWTKISGGLASYPGFKRNLHRHSDPTDHLTQLKSFSSVGLDTNAKAGQRQDRQMLYSLLDSIYRILSPTRCSCLFFMSAAVTPGSARRRGSATALHKAAGCDRYLSASDGPCTSDQHNAAALLASPFFCIVTSFCSW